MPENNPIALDTVSPNSVSVPDIPNVSAAGQPLRFADLYAGIGGFHLAWAAVGGQCALVAESNPSARSTYERNFAAASPLVFSDPSRFPRLVEDVPPRRLINLGVEVVCAGFPCQPFSHAGKRQGFMDPRGGAFFDLLRLLRGGRPPAFVFENVAGLVTHRGGRTMQQVIGLLEQDAGYTVSHRVLRACDYGVPQLRPRVFIVGFADHRVAERFVWPPPVPLTTTLSDVLGGRCDRDVGYTVLASWEGKGFKHSKPGWDAYLVDGREHRLTVDEIRQLQGFPDGFWLPGKSSASRLLGNAVAVPVATAVARQMVAALRGHNVDVNRPSATLSAVEVS